MTLPSVSDVKVFLMFHRLHPEVFPDIMEYVIPIAQAYCEGRLVEAISRDPSAKPSPQPQELSVENWEKFLWEWHNIFAPNRLDWMKQNLKELATAIHKKVYGSKEE